MIIGPGVIADEPTAVLLSLVLRDHVNGARARTGAPADPRLVEFAEECIDVAESVRARLRARPSFDDETPVADGSFVAARSALMSSSDVADLLGCTPQYVTHLARDGALRGHQARRTWTFHQEDVESFIATRMETT